MALANDKSQALRYLLLRHIWRAKESVSISIYREVTGSLDVNSIEKGFSVKWVNNGKDYEKKYVGGEYSFFNRGDKVRHGDDHSIDYNTNNDHAIAFAKEALEIDELNDGYKKEILLSVNIFTILIYAIFPTLLWVFEGKEFFIGFICLILLFASEFWYIKGKLFVPLILMGFIYTGLVFTPLIGAIIFLLTQLLDPNKKLRGLRILLSSVSSLFISIYIIWNESTPLVNPWLMIIILTAIGSFLINWTYKSHFRSFPLVFPFLSIGMYLDGYIVFSVLTLAFSGISVLCDRIGFHLFPTQRIK